MEHLSIKTPFGDDKYMASFIVTNIMASDCIGNAISSTEWEIPNTSTLELPKASRNSVADTEWYYKSVKSVAEQLSKLKEGSKIMEKRKTPKCLSITTYSKHEDGKWIEMSVTSSDIKKGN